MNDAAASKVFVKLLMIGNIVTMRKKHNGNPAEIFQPAHQGSRKSRGVDQDVPFRPQYEIRRRSIGIGRRESTKIDVLVDQFRIGGRGGPDVQLSVRPYRPGGTGDQGHARSKRFRGRARLVVNDRVVLVFLEHRRRNLPA